MWLIAGVSGTAALIVAQQSSSDPTTSFAQLGIASIVCALLFTAVWTLWRDNRNLRADIATLQDLRLRDRDAQVTRERELADRLAPLLAQSADLLARAPLQFDRALSEAQRSTGQQALDAVVRRLEATTERLGEEREH